MRPGGKFIGCMKAGPCPAEDSTEAGAVLLNVVGIGDGGSGGVTGVILLMDEYGVGTDNMGPWTLVPRLGGSFLCFPFPDFGLDFIFIRLLFIRVSLINSSFNSSSDLIPGGVSGAPEPLVSPCGT